PRPRISTATSSVRTGESCWTASGTFPRARRRKRWPKSSTGTCGAHEPASTTSSRASRGRRNEKEIRHAEGHRGERHCCCDHSAVLAERRGSATHPQPSIDATFLGNTGGVILARACAAEFPQARA